MSHRILRLTRLLALALLALWMLSVAVVSATPQPGPEAARCAPGYFEAQGGSICLRGAPEDTSVPVDPRTEDSALVR